MMRGGSWYAAGLAMATGGRPVQSGEELKAVARAVVMLALEQGPRAVTALPRAWPVTGRFIRSAARELARHGLVDGDPGPHGDLELTLAGRSHLAAMRGEVRESA